MLVGICNQDRLRAGVWPVTLEAVQVNTVAMGSRK